MLRVLLVILLPMAAPFLVYAACVWYLRRNRGGTALDLQRAPWAWILGVGICCSLVGLLYLRFSSNLAPGTYLEPPAWVDGEIVPSHPAENQPGEWRKR